MKARDLLTIGALILWLGGCSGTLQNYQTAGQAATKLIEAAELVAGPAPSPAAARALADVNTAADAFAHALDAAQHGGALAAVHAALAHLAPLLEQLLHAVGGKIPRLLVQLISDML